MLILSLVGALLVVIGWFIDRALELDWLRRRLAVKAHIGLRALDALRSNPSLEIERNDPAFAVLSSIWPQFPTEPSIRAIGRTVAYVQFGPEVTNEIGLTLFGEDLERIEKHDWTISQAGDALIGPLKKRLHRGSSRRHLTTRSTLARIARSSTCSLLSRLFIIVAPRSTQPLDALCLTKHILATHS
jgi:hypothetical protein